MKGKDLKIDIIANSMVEPGLSGGNRIFIELAKRWCSSGVTVNVFTSSEGEKICLLNGLRRAYYFTWKLPNFLDVNNLSRLEVFFLYLVGLFKGMIMYWRFLKKVKERRVIWSSSDFWPDFFPGMLAKLTNRRNFWIGSLFLFAPNPFLGFREKGKIKFPSIKSLIFYFSQKPVYFLIKKFANLIFVTSEPDKKRFIKAGRKPDSVVVIKGGVDISEANKYFKDQKRVKKEFDACFVGRFHEQKGVLELIDIWSEVCKIKKRAKLAMIGGGELEEKVQKKIRQKKMENNIFLCGFLGDGKEKFDIFKKSKIVVHPAVYDSGGMAAAEAMAWGLPGVSFDLEALKTYYPYGILKAKVGDIKGFAALIIELLKDKGLYDNTSIKARELIIKEWDWKKKADRLQKLICHYESSFS